MVRHPPKVTAEEKKECSAEESQESNKENAEVSSFEILKPVMPNCSQSKSYLTFFVEISQIKHVL